MVLGSIGAYAKELFGPVKGAVETLADPSKYLDKIKAYGAYDFNNNWFCNPDEPVGFVKEVYTKGIDSINGAVNANHVLDPSASLEKIGDRVINSDLEVLGKQAECLKDVYGINPDSVAQLSGQSQDVFTANLDKVIDTAPTLVKYATVPEIGRHLSDFANTALGYLVVGSDAVQSKSAEMSAVDGDMGLILGISFACLSGVLYGIKKLNREKLFIGE